VWEFNFLQHHDVGRNRGSTLTGHDPESATPTAAHPHWLRHFALHYPGHHDTTLLIPRQSSFHPRAPWPNRLSPTLNITPTNPTVSAEYLTLPPSRRFSSLPPATRPARTNLTTRTNPSGTEHASRVDFTRLDIPPVVSRTDTRDGTLDSGCALAITTDDLSCWHHQATAWS
jgi:hypothetical protein